MSNDFPTRYDHAANESKIYALWEKSGYFNPDNLPVSKAQSARFATASARRAKHKASGAKRLAIRAEPFTIMIAPPNITGSLHLGHALENTISDILVRYHRMKGYRTLWLPGTDHAGIATQNVVEKELKKQGLSRHALGREKFLEKIWEWKDKYGGVILEQLKKLGCSLDWSRTRFTMDEDYQASVKAAFEAYREKGLVYQGERVINWCIKDQTALSDLELEYEEEEARLWYLKYPLVGNSKFITVATTRPETMLGDTAVAVNPKDERYKDFVGKKVLLPIVNREIPIIADHKVEMEFGTGAVKVTPAHDLADSDIAERNKLPYLKVINEVGKIINVGLGFDGLKIAEAREKVVEEFKKLSLFDREEKFKHNVAKCYRCGSVIEPLLSKQWFLKMEPLAKKAIKAIEKGEVEYFPERWKEIALDWLRNVRDWCISRQIWWGHKIPMEGSEDTFDTWFSSALWPFATLGWPERSANLKRFYPTTFITSAREILHLWISRMIFSGIEFMGKPPFKTVLIHGTILTKEGKRMSKSLGTGIDPLDLIEKHGADAVRFGLIWQAMGNQDIRWDEAPLEAGKKFVTKLWNISRFILAKTGGAIHPKEKLDELKPEDRSFLDRLTETKRFVEGELAEYRFGQALHAIYDFVWHDFADKYIELSKGRNDENIKMVLGSALLESIKMLHPFMPFVTEEIYQKIEPGKLLIVEEL